MGSVFSFDHGAILHRWHGSKWRRGIVQRQLAIGGLSRNALLVAVMLVFAGQTSMLCAQEGTHEEEHHGHDNAVAFFLGGATHSVPTAARAKPASPSVWNTRVVWRIG